jgi:hypothetical protein
VPADERVNLKGQFSAVQVAELGCSNYHGLRRLHFKLKGSKDCECPSTQNSLELLNDRLWKFSEHLRY